MLVMSERFHDNLPTYEPWRERQEQDPLLETQKILREIEELMAKLIEQGDLDPVIKQSLRNKIANLMSILGINDRKEYLAFLNTFNNRVNRRRHEPSIPTDFPSLEQFRGNY